MGSNAFDNAQTCDLQSPADAAEDRALQRFRRWQEFVRAVHVAIRRDELSARLDIVLRHGSR